ncbi:hypothetical protein DL96DRAFT_1627044 [Flagelloscypha sp. PMI_526]|nr:hypothetical protein DL96DRAFT_1627044 [Flagelloscypha sp. PMI_526]
MDSQRSSLPPAPFSIDLPREIVFDILEAYLSLPRPKSIFSVLLLSKWSYSWMLPKLYHTLSVVTSDYSRPGRAVQNELLRCATPSLALVRRLECSSISENFSFLSFSNITHLSLWNSLSSEWYASQCLILVTLRLEELFMWYPSDLNALASKLSETTPICRKIRRLGFHSSSISIPDRRWAQYCENLTHVLVFCSNFQNLSEFLRHLLPTFPTLQCFVIGATWDYNPKQTDMPELNVGGDRRVAFVLQHFDHFETHGNDFWSGQSAMWAEVEEHIARNPYSQVFSCSLFCCPGS